MPTLHILGCSDAFNSGGRRQTSFLLEKEDIRILIDCGANTALAFKQTGRSFNEIDVVVITHFHGDHYGGLPYLILEAAVLQNRAKPLTVISPPGLKNRLYKLMSLLYEGSENSLDAFPIHYQEFENAKPLDLSFGRLIAYKVKHKNESKPHGVRIELGNKTFAYSGDTAWHENLPVLSGNADVFICECNFYERETDSHLNYQALLEKQHLLKAKKIFLTHLGDKMLEKAGQLKIKCLEDDQRIDF